MYKGIDLYKQAVFYCNDVTKYSASKACGRKRQNSLMSFLC